MIPGIAKTDTDVIPRFHIECGQLPRSSQHKIRQFAITNHSCVINQRGLSWLQACIPQNGLGQVHEWQPKSTKGRF